MITCPICKTEHEDNVLQELEIECRFRPIEGISQNMVRYQCSVCNVIFGPMDMLNLDPKKLTQAYLDIYSSGYHEANSTNLEFYLLTTLSPIPGQTFINFGGGGINTTSQRAKDELGVTLINYDPGFSLNISLPNQKIDGIISNNVLDHLQDPIKELLFMKSLLKEGACMTHCSDGFYYLVPFTKYHLYFFICESFNYVTKAINMNQELIVVPSYADASKIIKLSQIKEE